jgi:DNA-3-methyladenine glycosylase II
MPRPEAALRAGADALAERDPVIARLREAFGPPVLRRPSEPPFAALVRSVTHQQLAGPAARAIHGRLVAALAGEVTPERVLATPDDVLRGCGLSLRKIASVQDLARKALDGSVRLDPRRLARTSDDEIVAALSTVTGIGRWSAEIFLIFSLRRPDVWPTGDLGVRKGYAAAWGGTVPTPKHLDPLGEPYRPYRTVLAWYCWQAASGAGAPPIPQ